MSGYIKVWAMMITNFLFSISVITFVFAYGFLGAMGEGKLNILFMETFGEAKIGEVLMQGVMPEALITTLLWFSVFVFIVCLILHFFIETKIKVLLFPGSLCFLSVFFIQATTFIINSFIPTGIPEVTREFLGNFFGHINQASLIIGGIGMILLIVSCFNIYLVNKNSKL